MRPLRVRPLLLIATLLLGYAAHGWHHVVDRDCDSGVGPGAHACVVCTALHGNALVDATPQAAPPAPTFEHDVPILPVSRGPVLVARGASVPRAPPSA